MFCKDLYGHQCENINVNLFSAAEISCQYFSSLWLQLNGLMATDSFRLFTVYTFLV